VTFDALLAIVVTGLIAGLLAYVLTPWTMRLATRFGAIDNPDSGRRIHVRPIPRAGGLAVMVSFVVVGLVALLLQAQLELYSDAWRWQPERWFGFQGPSTEQVLLAVFGGAALAAVFGLIDDKWQIRARWQFGFQVVLAAVAIVLGLQILEINNPLEWLGGAFADDTLVFEGVLASLITALWVVGMINSINFIDGLDGLSTGVAIIAALTLGIVSLGYESSYQLIVALLCAIFAGALVGYLPWNFNPARVFIGTTGVMVMGYLLAVLAILGSAKVPVALLILGVPIIDTFWIITRRILSGHSPFTPDRGHIHHRLLDLGLSHRGVVLAIYAITATLALISLVLAGGPGPIYAFMAIVVASGIVLLLFTFRGPDEALEAMTYEDAEGVPLPPGPEVDSPDD
jgi:UDP-GlcNAc:undecaprenyl-phosphate GlcNAc-1-phosphate transferase